MFSDVSLALSSCLRFEFWFAGMGKEVISLRKRIALGFLFHQIKSKCSCFCTLFFRWCPCCCVRGLTQMLETTGTIHRCMRQPLRAR